MRFKNRKKCVKFISPLAAACWGAAAAGRCRPWACRRCRGPTAGTWRRQSQSTSACEGRFGVCVVFDVGGEGGVGRVCVFVVRVAHRWQQTKNKARCARCRRRTRGRPALLRAALTRQLCCQSATAARAAAPGGDGGGGAPPSHRWQQKNQKARCCAAAAAQGAARRCCLLHEPESLVVQSNCSTRQRKGGDW